MGIGNRYEGIDEYAVRLIKYKANQLIGKVGFTENDREDLEQELVFDLLCHLPKFNPDRAQLNTFISRVVEHMVIRIIEGRNTDKRDYRLCDYSLNESMEDKDNNQIEYIDTIDQNEYFIKKGRYSRPLEEIVELSIYVRQIITGLPPNLRTLCELLQEETITEISKNRNIPRGTIYESIKKIREMFEDSGT